MTSPAKRTPWAAIAVGAAVFSAAHSGAQAPVLGVTRGVKINGESGGTPRTYTPAAVLVDPRDPMRLYAAAVELASRRCGFWRSRDGGRTWRPGASPSPAFHPLCSHTSALMPMGALAMGQGGTIYYLHRAWSHQDEGPEPNSSVFLARSDDSGATWATTPVRDARGGHAPNNEVNLPADVAVDSRGADDVVYVSWTTTYPSALPRRPPKPTLAVSTDGGRAFSDPIDITGTFFDNPANVGDDVPEALRRREHFGGAIPYLALDNQGVLAASWVGRAANVPVGRGQARYLSRSHDRGKTFSVRRITPASPLGGTGTVLAWTAHGGVAGTLHAVYEGKEPAVQGDRDVHYQRSGDGGRTWSEATVLNDDDPAQLFSQLLPAISAAPNGRLDAAWWDTRRGAHDYATDVYHTRSDDGGRSWSANVALTGSPVSRRFGSWVDHFGDARQAPALASSDALAVVAWDDTRLGTTTSLAQDLYGAVVQYRPLSRRGASSAPLYAGAALAGTVVGLAAALVRRRRHLARMRNVVSL